MRSIHLAGGRLRWPVLPMAMVATLGGHLVLELCNNYLPAIYPVLVATMGLSYAQVGLLSMLSGAMGTVFQPLIGFVADRQDSRVWGAASLIWIGVFMGMVGLMGSYVPLAIMIALGGLGSAAFHPVGAGAISVISQRRRGAAMSLFSVSGNVGAALSPLVITLLLPVMGLRGTLVLIPLGLAFGWLLWKEMPRGGADAAERARRQAVAHTGRLAGLLIAMWITMMHSYLHRSVTTYMSLLYQARGSSIVGGSSALSVLLFSLGLGSMAGGLLADRIGRWQTSLGAFLLMPLSLLAFLYAPTELSYALVALLGVLIGMPFPINLVMGNESWPHMPAVASGVVLGAGWLVGALGAWVTGMLADRWGLTAALTSLIVPTMLAAVGALAYARFGGPRRGELAEG